MRQWKPLLALVLATTASVLLAGCGIVVQGSASAVPSAPPASAPAGTLMNDGTLLLSPDSQCAVEGDLEDRFTSSDQMPYFLECIIPQINGWAGWAYGDPRFLPVAYYFVPQGVKGNNDCDFDDTVYQYCLKPQAVYLGEQTAWLLYHKYGDAAAAMGLAHEVGHHFQLMMGLPESDPDVPNEQIRFENQADCAAGAWAKYSLETGYLSSDDDIGDVAGAMELLGNADITPQSSHGTIDQRIQAFAVGYRSPYNNGLYGCNDYVPEVALTPYP